MTGAHDDDPVGECHGFRLVVGHVKHGFADTSLQKRDLLAHARAQFRVKIRKRFIEQENGRIAHQCPTERNALHLPAGQLSRLAVEQMGDVEHPRGLIDTFGDPGRIHAPHAQAERHVVADRFLRIERIVLEHHRDVPVLGLMRGNVAPGDEHLPRGDRLKARNHAQGGRFAAAGRSKQHNQLALFDIQIDAGDGDGFAVGFTQSPQADFCHAAASPRASASAWLTGVRACLASRKRAKPAS